MGRGGNKAEGPQYDEIPYGDMPPVVWPENKPEGAEGTAAAAGGATGGPSGKGQLPQVPAEYSQIPQIPARQGIG